MITSLLRLSSVGLSTLVLLGGCSLVAGTVGNRLGASDPPAQSSAPAAQSSSTGAPSTNKSGATATRKRGEPLAPGHSEYVDPGPHHGPLAEKYAGKVVFSSEAIPYKGSDDSSVYTTYQLGAPLYIRYWGNESPHNLQPDCTKHRVISKAHVNGGESVLLDVLTVSSPRDRGASTLTRDGGALTSKVILDQEKLRDRDAAHRFNTEVIGSLVEGKNMLRVVFSLDCDQGIGADPDPIVAEGTIEVLVKPGSLRSYKAKYDTELPRSPHRENAKLVPQILAAMKTVPSWETEEMVGALVFSRDWEPIRTRKGLLLAEEISAALIVRKKTEKNPEACRIFDMSYRRNAGSKELRHYGTGDMLPFPCSKAPKR